MTQPSPFKWFQTSPEIIRLAVMLYIRFPLSLCNVEELLHGKRDAEHLLPVSSCLSHRPRAYGAEVLDLERDDKMGVHLDGMIGVGVSRLEVIEGPSGRRRRTKAERARIAAESLKPGAKVTNVARRHGTSRWQIYDWRRQLRAGQLILPVNVACL